MVCVVRRGGIRRDSYTWLQCNTSWLYTWLNSNTSWWYTWTCVYVVSVICRGGIRRGAYTWRSVYEVSVIRRGGIRCVAVVYVVIRVRGCSVTRRGCIGRGAHTWFV